MKSELVSQEKNIVTLKVTLPAEDFKAGYDRTLKNVAKNVNIPGFRKGKAPRQVIEARFGANALRAETLEDMLPDVLQELVQEYELDPIEEPQVKIESFEDGKDIELTVVYTNHPEVTLPDLSTLEVERPVMTITDKMVDDAFDSLRQRYSTWTVVDRAAQAGDRMKAKYATTIKDEKDTELSSHDPREQLFNLDSSALRTEVLDVLVGAKAGDHLTTEVKIDDQYGDKNLAGNRACYTFDVLEVLEGKPAEINEELFSKIGSDIKDETQAKAALKTQLEARLQSDLKNAVNNNCLNRVVEASEVELPESMVERQKKHLLAQAEENVKQRANVSLEEYYQAQGQDFEEFKKELEVQARADVKQFLVVDAAAKEFNVDVTSADLDEEVAEVAKKYGVDPATVKNMMGRNPDELRSYYSSARYRKTLSELLSRCKVIDVQKDIEG